MTYAEDFDAILLVCTRALQEAYDLGTANTHYASGWDPYPPLELAADAHILADAVIAALDELHPERPL